MVDRRGIEPLLEACKATVLPLSLPAHITYYLSYYTPQVKANLVPDVWFEQTTYRLQGDCTTAVLIRQSLYITMYLVGCQLVRREGLEPPAKGL